jgi:hypothetical protein
MNRLIFLSLGVLFGWLLSRVGATTFDYYAKLFLFQDLQLMKVIGVAAVTGMIGIYFIQRWKLRALFTGADISLKGKPMTKGLITGSILFGIGWGLTGSCPGTAMAMIGEGKLAPLFTLFGMLIGTYIYTWQFRPKSPTS